MIALTTIQNNILKKMRYFFISELKQGILQDISLKYNALLFNKIMSFSERVFYFHTFLRLFSQIDLKQHEITE